MAWGLRGTGIGGDCGVPSIRRGEGLRVDEFPQLYVWTEERRGTQGGRGEGDRALRDRGSEGTCQTVVGASQRLSGLQLQKLLAQRQPSKWQVFLCVVFGCRNGKLSCIRTCMYECMKVCHSCIQRLHRERLAICWVGAVPAASATAARTAAGWPPPLFDRCPHSPGPAKHGLPPPSLPGSLFSLLSRRRAGGTRQLVTPPPCGCWELRNPPQFLFPVTPRPPGDPALRCPEVAARRVGIPIFFPPSGQKPFGLRR